MGHQLNPILVTLLSKTMFTKLVCVSVVLALAQGFPQAPVQKVWPAGVSPAACPNYPDCDNNIDPTLGVPRQAPSPAYPALKWPAGVAPASCPNFPDCSTAGSVVPVGYVNTAGYPAGVNAATCPNFPFC